jgi:hypothetical protein
MYKICSKCKEFKPHNLRKGGRSLQSYCIECQREYSREHYKANKDKANSRRVINSKTYRDKMRKLIAELKNVPCTDCGQMYPHYVMDFDHLEDFEKLGNVASMAVGVSLVRLLAEIEKCEIVCANCHRIRTFNRRNGI